MQSTHRRARCFSQPGLSQDGQTSLLLWSSFRVHSPHLFLLSKTIISILSCVEGVKFSMVWIALRKPTRRRISERRFVKNGVARCNAKESKHFFIRTSALILFLRFEHLTSIREFTAAMSSMPKNTRNGQRSVFAATVYEWHSQSKQSVPPFVEL